VNPRKMTPEVLAAKDGILAVFVGFALQWGDHLKWRAVAMKTLSLAAELKVDDLTVRVADAQLIRLLSIDDLECIVVYNPDGKIMKSLPRCMRRCVEHVRRAWREQGAS